MNCVRFIDGSAGGIPTMRYDAGASAVDNKIHLINCIPSNKLHGIYSAVATLSNRLLDFTTKILGECSAMHVQSYLIFSS